MNNIVLSIDTMLHGGFGIGYLPGGQDIRVRQVIPGEEIEVRLPEKSKQAELVRVIRESCDRVVPACPYYGRCGGCDFQHIAYPRQLQIKTQILAGLFKDHNLPDDLIQPIIPAPEPFHYRQRIRLQKTGRRWLGFRKYHSHEVQAIEACLLARRELNDALSFLLRDEAGVRLVEISTEVELLLNPATERVKALFFLSRKPRPADRQQAGRLCAGVKVIEGVFFQGEDFPLAPACSTLADTAASNQLTIHYPESEAIGKPFSLSWEVGGFCQVNLQQNRQLIDLVANWAACAPDMRVLDLFCGMGNFSIPLSRMAGQLIGIEGQGAAIRSAEKNSGEGNCTNTLFLKADVHKECCRRAAAREQFEIILIDPPRAGVPDLAHALATLCRKRMIYISCDPVTLCRDLADLCRADFTLVTIQPVDMFPQTHHLETVVLLEKD